MSRQSPKKKLPIKNVEKPETTNPKTAKLVLFIFGIGPLLLMGLFLTYNGFFSLP